MLCHHERSDRTAVALNRILRASFGIVRKQQHERTLLGPGFAYWCPCEIRAALFREASRLLNHGSPVKDFRGSLPGTISLL